MGFQRVEPRRPQPPVGLEPFVDRPQRLGPDPVDPPLRVDSRLDQPRVAQHPEVLGHRRLAQSGRVDQLADGTLGRDQQIEDLPSMRLGEYGERGRHQELIYMISYMRVKTYDLAGS